MADEPPHLTVVSEQSEEERERQIALGELTWRMRLVSGNLLRVIAGAGEPHNLAQQTFELGQAIKDLPHGTLVWQVNEALAAALEDGLESTENLRDFDDAVGDIEQAALRVIAARLLGQRVQVTRRQNDFFHAFRRLEEIRENNRREAASAPRLPRSRKARADVIRRLTKSLEAHTKPKSVAPKQKPAARKIEKAAPDDKPVSTAEFMKRRHEELGREK